MAWLGSRRRRRGAPLSAGAARRRVAAQHRGLVVLAVAGIALSFALDLLFPGYAIAGFYLLPLLLVTFALSERRAVALVGAVCLGLTICVLVLQGRTNAQNILLVGFGALAGAGLIALGSLYSRYDRLYEKERVDDGPAPLADRAAPAAAGGVGARLGAAAVGAAARHRRPGPAAPRHATAAGSFGSTTATAR